MQNLIENNLPPQFHDPRWRLNNIYSIVDKSSRRIKFQENHVQKAINDELEKYLRIMILKARQFGVTTDMVLYLFDKCIWNENKTCVILAHEQDAIKKIFRIVRRAYDYLDDAFKPVLDRGGGSKYELYFPEINSRIYCDLESRGDTITDLHISECAFLKTPDKMFSTMQAVPLGGAVTIESTPNGLGNHFYDMWNDEGKIYKKLFFPWYVHQEYMLPTPRKIKKTDDEKDLITKARVVGGIRISDKQIAFRRFKKEELRHSKTTTFEQEYPEDDHSCFLASGGAAMDLAFLMDLKEKLKKPIKVIPEHKFNPKKQNPFTVYEDLHLYEDFNKSHRYCIGADPAEGIGGDRSSLTVWNMTKRRQAAALAGNITPYQFAHMLNKVGLMFKAPGKPSPKIIVERNNHGHAVLLELERHIKYMNIYRDKQDRPGWVSDRVSRPLMMDTFIEAVHNSTVELTDVETINECLTLIVNNGKIEAAEKKHDDRVISSALGLQIVNDTSHDVYDNIGDRILT